MNIYEKLQVIQTRLKAPKSQRNDFGKYNYRNCEDILEAVKPLLAEVKAALTITDEIIVIGERYYIKATAILHDAEEYNTISNTAYAREEESKKGMDGSQVTGASSSYARKYALNGLFAIDDTKDSDTTNTGDSTEKTAQKPVLDKTLLNKAKGLNIELDNIAKYLKKDVSDITNADLKKCIDQKLKALAEKQTEVKE